MDLQLSKWKALNFTQLPTSNYQAKCHLPGAGFPRLKPQFWAQQVIQLGKWSVNTQKLGNELLSHYSFPAALKLWWQYPDSTLWCSSIIGQTSKLSLHRVRRWSSARMSKSLQIPSLPVNMISNKIRYIEGAFWFHGTRCRSKEQRRHVAFARSCSVQEAFQGAAKKIIRIHCQKSHVSRDSVLRRYFSSNKWGALTRRQEADGRYHHRTANRIIVNQSQMHHMLVLNH